MLRTAATSFAIRHYDEVTESPMWSELGAELRNEVGSRARPLGHKHGAAHTHAVQVVALYESNQHAYVGDVRAKRGAARARQSVSAPTHSAT